MEDLIERDSREPFFADAEPLCRRCGEPAQSCDCDGFSTRQLVGPASYEDVLVEQFNYLVDHRARDCHVDGCRECARYKILLRLLLGTFW